MADSKPKVVSKRVEDFLDFYANNVQLETTVYDVKLIFGQSAQHTGTEVIEQSLAVTVPWGSVKMLLYYLEVNLILREAETGPIKLHRNQIPLPLDTLPPELQADPDLAAAVERVKKIRENFIADAIKA